MYKKYVKSGNIKRPYYYASIRVKGQVKNFYLGRSKAVAQKKEKELLTKQQSKQSKIIHTFKTKINYNKTYPFILIALIVFGMSFFYIFKETGITGITGLAVWETKTQAGFDAGNYTNTTEYSPDGFVGLTSNDTEQELSNNQFDELDNLGFTGINMTDNVLLLHLNDESAYGENGTHAYDFSGNDNNGTFYNNVTTGIGSDTGPSGANETGKFSDHLNASYAFDGDGDEIRIPDSVSLSPTDMTIALWIYPIELGRNQILVAKDDNYNGWGRSFGFFIVSTNILRFHACETDALVTATDTTTKISQNNWTHVAVTYDYVADGSSITTIYINGEQEAGASDVHGPLQNTLGDITIGRREIAGYDDFFNGTMDEIAIWNRTLSETEIEAIYDRQKGEYIDKGHYLSEVFDSAERTRWNNISWAGGITYGEMPSDQKDEINDGVPEGINMTGNILLLHLNNDSSYGENQTYVYDFSGNDNNGTALGGGAVPNVTEYRVGSGSFEFLGGDDYIRIDNPKFAGWNTTGTFTAWAYFDFGDGDSIQHYLVDTRGADSNYGIIVGKGWDTGEGVAEPFLCGWRTTDGVTDWNGVEYAWTQEKEKWHHFAMTWDANTITKTCYIDGTILYNNTAGNFMTDVSAQAYIGVSNDGSTVDWDGKMDEISFWNRTLSTAEIQDLYKRGALRLNVSVRSCDDSECSGESWSNTYTSTPQNLAVPANRYFQYRAEFEAYNTSLTPQLYNVTVDHDENLFVIDDDWGNCCCVDNETTFVDAIVNVTGCDFHVNGTLYLTNTLVRIDGGDGSVEADDFEVDAGGLLYANESTLFEEDGEDVYVSMIIDDNATFEHNTTFSDKIRLYIQGNSHNVFDGVYLDDVRLIYMYEDSVNYFNHSNITAIDYFDTYGNSHNTFDNVSFLGLSTTFQFYGNSNNTFNNVSFTNSIGVNFYETSNNTFREAEFELGGSGTHMKFYDTSVNTFQDSWGALGGGVVNYFYMGEDSTNRIENSSFSLAKMFLGNTIGGAEYPNATFVNFTFTGAQFQFRDASHAVFTDSSINASSITWILPEVAGEFVEMNNLISDEKMYNEYAVNTSENHMTINLTNTNLNNVGIGQNGAGTFIVRDSEVMQVQMSAGDNEMVNTTVTGASSTFAYGTTTNSTIENSTIQGAISLYDYAYTTFRNVNFQGAISLYDYAYTTFRDVNFTGNVDAYENANTTFEDCYFDRSTDENDFYDDSNTTFIRCNSSEAFDFGHQSINENPVVMIRDSEFWTSNNHRTFFRGRANVTIVNTNFTGVATNDYVYFRNEPNVTFEQPYSYIYEILVGAAAGENPEMNGYVEIDHYNPIYGPGIYLGATFNRYFPFNLTYSGGDPAEGINVSISENSTNPFTSGLTDSNGFVNLNLTFDVSMVDTEFEIYVDGVKKRNLTWMNSTAPYGIEFDMPPNIEFVSPSWDNGTATGNTSLDVNISIPHAGDLDNFTWNWNGTNYTFYDDSLVLMLNFDNVSALGENDTFAKDLSNYGHDGLAWGDAQYDTSGKYGGAFTFDGTDDYINVTSLTVINNSQGEFSVEAWATMTSQPIGYLIIVGKWGPGHPEREFVLGYDGAVNAKIYAGTYDDIQDNTQNIFTTYKPPLNTWFHVVFTYDGTNQKMYINGTLDKTQEAANYHNNGPGSYIVIGNTQTLNNDWPGLIDEVRILNRSLTAEEINQSYMSNLRKYDTNNWEFYTNQTQTPDSGLVEGDYTYYANARDDGGNENMTEERTITLDLTPPTLVFENQTDEQGIEINETTTTIGAGEEGENVTLRVDVSDTPAGVDKVWVYIWETVKDGAVWLWGWLTDVGSNIWEFTFNVNASWNISVYNYTIYANDTFGNEISIEGNFSQCSPPQNDEWNITLVCNMSNHANLTVAEDYNLSILDGGHLILENTTLYLNPSADGKSGIEVFEGGKLDVCCGSNITSTLIGTNPNSFFFSVDSGSNFSMLDSYLSGAGWNTRVGQRGLEINTTVTEFRRNIIDGNSRYGVVIYSDDNVIDSNNISDYVTYGIYVEGSYNNITFNNVTAGSGNPIWLKDSNWNNITNNTADSIILAQGSGGPHLYATINLQTSENNTLQGNTFLGQGIGIYFNGATQKEYYNHSIDTSNTVSGGTVYFYFDSNNTRVENNLDAGTIIIAYSDNVTVYNNILTGNHSIVLYGATNTTVDTNYITQTGSRTVDRYKLGMYMLQSNNNSIKNNTLYSSVIGTGGILVSQSDYNHFSLNNVTTTSTQRTPFWLEYSDYNLIWDSNFTSPSTSTGFEVIYLGGTNGDVGFNNFTNVAIISDSVDREGIDACDTLGENMFIDSKIENSTGSYIAGTDVNSRCNNYVGSLYFINSSLDVTDITVATDKRPVYVQWRLNIYVNDTYGTALDDANVSIFNRTDDPVSEELTSSGDITEQILTEFIQDNTNGQTFWTNYTINTSKTFYNDSGMDYNLTSSDSIIITLTDADPPHDITLNLPDNNNFTSDANVDFNWTALDHLDNNITCNITLNDAFNGTDIDSLNDTMANWTVVLPDALYEWNVTCWDDENQVNVSSESRNVTVDTTNPLVDLDYPSDDAWIDYENVSFNYTLTETNPDTCELWGNWTGSWAFNESTTSSALTSGITNNFTTLNLTDDIYLWGVMCNDSAGNANWSTNYTVKIDTITPLVDLDYPTDNLWSSSSSVTFNYTIIDSNPDTCELWHNASGDFIYNQTMASEILTNGTTNNFTTSTIQDSLLVWGVFCNDSANNGNWSTNHSFNVDTTNPIVNVDYPDNGSTVSAADPNKDFNFSITENNLDSCWYELNSSGVNVTIADCSGGNRSVVVSLVKALWNNISIWVNDSAGNEGTNITFVFTNTAPPNVSLSLPLNNSQHVYNNLTFQWLNVSDEDGDHVYFDINVTDENFVQVSLNESIDGLTYSNETLPDGWHYWTVRAFDGNDYGNWNDSYFYVDVVNATITVSHSEADNVLRPGNSLTITGTQVTRSDWITNFTIVTVVGGVETDCGADNSSGAGDSSWTCTYRAAADASTQAVNVKAYAYNRSAEENVSASTLFYIVTPAGPAVAAPRIVNFYPNVTYANGSETIGITLDLDLDVLNRTVEVTVTNGSITNTLVSDSIVSDDTTFDYVYNYSFLPSVVDQTYLFEASVEDQNNQVNTSNFTVFVKIPVNVNLSTVGGTDIRVKDINSGIVLVSGGGVDQSFTPGEYDVDVVTSIGTVTLFNATLNATAQVVLEYGDKDESAAIPDNTLGIDRFLMSSEQLFSNNARIVYDYSNVSTRVINKENLKVYKCASEASCTWSQIPDADTSVDTDAETVTASFGSFSIFLVAEDIATLTATTTVTAPGNPGGGGALQKASVKIITPAALTANPLKMLLEDRVSIPIQIKNNGNKPLTDVTISAVSENPLINLALEKSFIPRLDVGASETVIANVVSALTEPGVYSVKLTTSAASPPVSDDSELIIAVVSIFEEKVEQIITRVVFAKDLFKEHPECLELQELLIKADKLIEAGEYEKARTLTETAILGCQDMITALSLKKEIPGRLPFTKQQIIIFIVVISSALALLLYLITSRGFRGRTVIKREKTREKRRPAFKLPTFKFGKKKTTKKKADIWKRR